MIALDRAQVAPAAAVAVAASVTCDAQATDECVSCGADALFQGGRRRLVVVSLVRRNAWRVTTW